VRAASAAFAFSGDCARDASASTHPIVLIEFVISQIIIISRPMRTCTYVRRGAFIYPSSVDEGGGPIRGVRTKALCARSTKWPPGVARWQRKLATPVPTPPLPTFIILLGGLAARRENANSRSAASFALHAVRFARANTGGRRALFEWFRPQVVHYGERASPHHLRVRNLISAAPKWPILRFV
jgi:hypothetical protein